ncbi:MAG: CRISPR-associated helicase Cas3' [Immundisolibacter sp.]|uniref:CRISPR-associated helicase Cas3' n=1 Tax=Immundisolibacter sp. TaxID=1934948 RepID=UPI003EE3249B
MKPESDPYHAHSANAVGDWHLLKDHLAAVAKIAEAYAGHAPWAGEATLAGLLHDLGKYADRFQGRLDGKDSGLDHWSQGAWIVLSQYRAIAAALAIQGHHVGLQRGNRDALSGMKPEILAARHPFNLQLSDPDVNRLVQRGHADGLEFDTPSFTAVSLQDSFAKAVAAMLDVRLLFSCLVDADFLDTEAHFDGDGQGKRPRPAGPTLDAHAGLDALNRYMGERIRAGTQADAKVLAAREALWRATGEAASAAPGVFTLTAPTGSGKTLAMLRFAMEHAATHKLKRIVLAVPFLTVIEQTAREYRRVFAGFPDNFVLEHHSLAGLGEESEKRDAEGAQARQRRLLAENWDAPIVLTTNVQLLESLFSNRPSSCRKLHNLMESVILFDEAQSLPQHLAVPTLAALSHLSAAYRASIVFATATQPAFDTLHEPVTKHAASGWRPSEVVPGHPELFKTLKRVDVCWPKSGEKRTWPDLAAEISSTDQVLVVVNLKRHALALLDALGDTPDVFHLSTNLCADHRRAVLDKVRARLKASQPCHLISTQCVEAGVDVDFPKVYRALAPLEAVAQAAGRCNREGRMNAHGRLGKVIVFEPEEEGDWRRHYPTHAYYQATEATRTLLVSQGGLDINDPAVFQNYYRRLYDINNPASQNADLNQALTAADFVEVARLYRLIDTDAIQVLVSWADRRDDFRALRAEAEDAGITADWMRRAQGLAVGVYRRKDGPPAWAIPAKLRRRGKVDAGVSDEWFILQGNYYDATLGLKPPEGPQLFIA